MIRQSEIILTLQSMRKKRRLSDRFINGTQRKATVDRVTVPIGNDIMLINHTHPGGTASPSSADKLLLGRYQQLGSPQRSSEIIPIGKENIRFNTTGLIRGE